MTVHNVFMTNDTNKKPGFKKLILDDLKRAGHKAIAAKITSIRYSSFSMGDAVDVSAVNLFKSERRILESLLREYQAGSFDGMTDCYNYDNRDSGKARQAKYVHLRNEFSPEVKEAVKKTLAEKWEIIDDATAMAKRNNWFQSLIWQDCCELEAA